MAQIIKQPNGKYCIFSSVVDNVTHYDMTPQEIIDDWVNEYKEEITKKVTTIITKLDNNERPYHQFTQSYDEMLEFIESVYGIKERNEINKLCQIE